MIKGLIYLVTLGFFFISCTSNNSAIDLEKIDFSRNVKKLYSDINCIELHKIGEDTTVDYTNIGIYEIRRLGIPYHPSNEENTTKWTLPGYLYFEENENPYDNWTKEEMGNNKCTDSIAFFKSIYFNRVDVITNPDTLAIGMIFNTRTNKKDSTYFDKEMKTLEYKLGKPLYRNRIFNGYYTTLKSNTWIIKDKIYQFWEHYISGPEVYGIELLIIDNKYLPLLEKEETPFISIYQDVESYPYVEPSDYPIGT
jgi:hypothetical protein